MRETATRRPVIFCTKEPTHLSWAANDFEHQADLVTSGGEAVAWEGEARRSVAGSPSTPGSLDERSRRDAGRQDAAAVGHPRKRWRSDTRRVQVAPAVSPGRTGPGGRASAAAWATRAGHNRCRLSARPPSGADWWRLRCRA